jgi:small subunit ribosomal protein S17
MSEPTTTSPAKTPPSPRPRGRRKVEIGTVTSDKMDKTRRVEVSRLVPHPKYGKYQKHRTVCYVHDEQNETRVGDLVEIVETRPLSKSKRWRLLRIVRKAPAHEEADARKAVLDAQANAEPAPDQADA